MRARAIQEVEPPVAGFAGSPTLLINAVDPFPATAPTTRLGCRYYLTETGLDAAPSVEQLITALRTRFAG